MLQLENTNLSISLMISTCQNLIHTIPKLPFHFLDNTKITSIGMTDQSFLSRILRTLNTLHAWTQQQVLSRLIQDYNVTSGPLLFHSQSKHHFLPSTILSWANISASSRVLFKNKLFQSLKLHWLYMLKSKETSERLLWISIMNSTLDIWPTFSKVYWSLSKRLLRNQITWLNFGSMSQKESMVIDYHPKKTLTLTNL